MNSFFIGRFSTIPFEEAGFVAPKLRYALRNPLLIGDFAQQVAKVSAQNLLDGVLRRPIRVSTAELNIVDGSLLQIDKGHVYLLSRRQNGSQLKTAVN